MAESDSAAEQDRDRAAVAAYEEAFREFTIELNRMHVYFGAPSYGTLVTASGRKLTKAGINEALTGKRLSSLEALLEFVRVVSTPPKAREDYRPDPNLLNAWRTHWQKVKLLQKYASGPLKRIHVTTQDVHRQALRDAEHIRETAQDVHEQALRDAEHIRETAQDVHEQALRDAEHIRETAQDVHEQALREAQNITLSAREGAARLLDRAREEATLPPDAVPMQADLATPLSSRIVRQRRRRGRLIEVAPMRASLDFEHHSYNSQLRSLAFSPDGQLLAAGAMDGGVWLWNPGVFDLQENAMFGHEGVVRAVAFSPSPDDQLLASAGEDGKVRLWNVTDRTSRGAPLPHSGEVWSVSFSPDGRFLATASDVVRIWKISDRAGRPTVLRGHSGAVRSVAFHPAGKLLASAGEDGSVRLWNAAGGKSHGDPIVHGQPVTSVTFSPDGHFLASASDVARVWRVAERLSRADRIQSGPVRSVAFSPDGRFLATFGYKTVGLWEPGTGVRRAAFNNPAEVWALAYSFDSSVVAWTQQDAALLHI
ncbi:WD40 repeat domain-containing protein [Streptomyces sp. SID1121]|uniref:WD40 repeat domain-containing protein n=1 Tax=Streptomyces sp. SID1121 TaxID=3425888 RepID=UPI004055BE8D